MQNIQSNLWRLTQSDLVKGLKVVVFTALAASVKEAFMTNGLQLAAYDWKMIGSTALIAGIGYLLNKFASDDQGKVLGKI